MKNTINSRILMWFYKHAIISELRRRKTPESIIQSFSKEYSSVSARAKDIGNSKLLSAYEMAMCFLALNYASGKDAEENYEILRDGLCASKIFCNVLADAESYLSEKKLPGRLKWAEDSHKKIYENDWVVDVLPGNEEYDLGYDYHECGVVKLCHDEGHPELAKYCCRMDFILADLMHMKLVRQGTLAEGADHCDFRYSRY